MADIVFINPPYDTIAKGYEYVKNISNSSPSLGLLHLSAQARQDGYEPMIIESDLDSLSPKEVVDIVVKANPKFVGITLFTVGVLGAVEIAKLIKEVLPNLPILVGGPHISSMGMITMKRSPMFDIAVINEGEQAISKLLPLLDTNQSVKDVAGIIYKNDKGELIQTAPGEIQRDLDKLPMPTWDILPKFPKGYLLTIYDYPKGPTATFSASRGCPFKCEFCDTSTFGAKIRYYSPAKVFEIMNHLRDKYNIQHLQFVDDLFVANKKRIGELCDLIIESNFKMTWSCTARVDTINQEILMKMKKAGCWEISYGLETGSNEMLTSMRKAITVEQSEQAINQTAQAGIRCKGLFMLGYPGETMETIEQTKAFVQRVPLTTMNLSKFTPYPGTPIYYKLYGTSIRDEDWDRMNGMNFIYEPENIPMDILNKEYKDILESFYKRPKILLHYVKNSILFPRHLLRLIKFGIGFFRSKFR